MLGQRNRADEFRSFIQDALGQTGEFPNGAYTNPTDIELREWSTALHLFRRHSIDSCKAILSKYNYSLIQLSDNVAGNVYDVFKEKEPVRHGWGTFIYNRKYTKRLYIHVNHPVDDGNAAIIGSELFRRTDAEWLFIAGTSKFASSDKFSSDVGRARRSVFQQWHEILANLTHVTISVHGFNRKYYAEPISSTDIIISNGKTSDEQWGISQLSLAFRDSLRASGFSSALAMYDSGYARLAGGWNRQGLFSNDSVGFGHWLYVELSNNIRGSAPEYHRFISATNHALELLGKKISHQINHAFGLVSPRVVRLDSLKGILFPPNSAETYRIIAFNESSKKSDTIDLRFGNWLQFGNSRRAVTTITRLDTNDGSFVNPFHQGKRKTSHVILAQMNETSGSSLPSVIRLKKRSIPDTTASVDEEERNAEPLQIHRIPLQPVFASTKVTPEYSSDAIPFRWEGVVNKNFLSHINTFQMKIGAISTDEFEAVPSFLIPIINRSYRDGKSHFIGIQMTKMLVNEIARLVAQHDVTARDLGLLAEESEIGEYYLRIFPGAKLARNDVTIP